MKEITFNIVSMLYFDVIHKRLRNGYLDYDHNADDSNDDSDSDHDDLPDL
jgi:hypothetical protein